MRKLMWLTLGFGAACAGCAYLLPEGGLWALAVLLLVCAVSGAVLGRKQWELGASALVFLGCAVGLVWWSVFDGAYLQSPRKLDGETCYAQICVTDHSYETDYGIGADGLITLDGRAYSVRFYLNEEKTLVPGDMVSGYFRFRLTTSDSEQGSTYHSGNGIYLLAYPSGKIHVTTGGEIPLRGYPAILRQKIIALLEAVFPEDTMAFAKALLLGDDSGIDYETDTAFKISGIRHIIAVSGLHVSILCGAICTLTGKRRVLTALVGSSVLLLFAAVVGSTPSITRACIMMILMLLAILFRREYDPPTALSFAVLVMLFANPLVITSVSFQLSVGCMIGIFLFASPIRQWLLEEKRLGTGKGKSLKARLSRWFAGSVSVTLGAMSLTTPLTAYYFGTVSLIGVLTNLCALWAVTFIFYGVLLSCLLGAIWLPLGKITAWAASWLIRYVLGISKLCASMPLAAVYTCSDSIVIWLVFCYLLLGGFLLSGRKQPLRYGCAAVIALCAALAVSWGGPMLDDFRMTVLDVGQGQCIVLQSEGKTFLVDCGGEGDSQTADIAAEHLLSQGISHLDGVILTHFDDDHAGGAPYLLTRVDTEVLLVPSYEENDLSLRENAVLVGEKTELTWGNTKITLFPAKNGTSGNENSLCVLFQTEKCDILITGDRTASGELELLQETELPELEALVVGHHGARTSTCEKLLAETSPALAIISVGADNSYGHPAAEVLERLENYGCLILRTDQDGTITFRG